MNHIHGVIEGTAPILFNRPYTEPSRSQPEAERMATARRERIYLEDGQVYWPSWAFKKMICVDGTLKAGLKVGRAGLASYALASVFLSDNPTFIGKSDMDFLHEVWGKIPPGKTGKLVKVWRPAMDVGWLLDFSFDVIDELVKPAQLYQALAVAGVRVGMGAWRPEYGRFVVREWEVTPIKT